MTPDPIAVVTQHWGDEAPIWIMDLARECAATSQAAVARKMNRSGALVSNVLRRKYEGSYEAVEEVFNGVFKGAVVSCPALGEIPANECRDWRLKSLTFVSVNRQRVEMYRACARCPRNQKGAAT